MNSSKNGLSRLAIMAGASAIALSMFQPSAASAQTAPAQEAETVVVTGFRASLQNALNQKRRSVMLVDVITAESVGKFPESNLTEALQRLPGISIERDNGEGRTVTVRGLSGDFVRTRLNGMETTATSGVNEGQTAINRTRGFDYNVFATDMFKTLKVLKSAQANVDEGSLGATVDIETGRPLDDSAKRRLVLSIQDAHYINDGKGSPRIAGAYSQKFFNNKLGIAISGAYNEREGGISSYSQNIGAIDWVYRNSDIAGLVQNGTGSSVAPVCNPNTTNISATTNISPLNCFWGFALPTNLRTSNPTSLGVASTSKYFGSDPAAYAILNSNPVQLYPGLLTLQQQELYQDRVGLTTSVQWKPTENTKVTANALYSRLKYDNHNYNMGTFGLNRQNDNARAEIGLTNATTGLRAFSGTGATYFGDRRGVYSGACVVSATRECHGSGTPGVGVLPTAQYWNGTGYTTVAGVFGVNNFSTNPYNLDVYDYYNNPNSVGYNAARALLDPRGILNYDEIVGKPHTTVQDAHKNAAGQIDYMKLNSVDWITQDAWSTNETKFEQYDLVIDHIFSDKLKMSLTGGYSKSELSVRGGRVDLYALDKDNYVYDYRNGGAMPTFNPGFNVADSSNWDLYKGYAQIQLYNWDVTNEYNAYRADFNYVFNNNLNFDFGLSFRKYGFITSRQELNQGQLPTIQELNKYGRDKGDQYYANITLAKLGKTITYGKGLDLSPGTPTSWFVPDRDAFQKLFNFGCNCANQFADWRTFPRVNDTQEVTEEDFGEYIQANFDYDVFGRRLRGNLGVRVVETKINSMSLGTTGVFAGDTTTGYHEYIDTLPSLNLAYDFTDKFMIRFAASQTMARPALGNLAPGVTAISIGTTPVSGSPPSITLGNPKLEPFRSDNLDLNFEWYFSKDSILSVAIFHKDLGSFPRQENRIVVLRDSLPADTYKVIYDNLTPVQQAYMSGEDLWNLRTYVDSPGGTVDGYEIQYQQNFTFLPAPYNGFGMQANFTHIDSSLSYLSQAGVRSTAPWPFAAPNAVNVTLFYEKGPFEGRISYSWRDRFASQFPQANGTCAPGLTTNNGGQCGAPFTDFVGTEATQYADAKFSYKFNERLKADLAIQNIFNETQTNWAYEPSVIGKYTAGAGTIVTLGARYTF